MSVPTGEFDHSDPFAWACDSHPFGVSEPIRSLARYERFATLEPYGHLTVYKLLIMLSGNEYFTHIDVLA
jgi:hypothetical protein